MELSAVRGPIFSSGVPAELEKMGGRLAPLVEFSFVIETVVALGCYDDVV